MKTMKLFYIIFALLLCLVAYIGITSNLHHKRISIAVGTKHGAYYQYAQKYKELLEVEEINLSIITTEGSIEAQKKLLNHEVDFAFVQSGTEDENISVLANIAYEPIWIFHRDKNLTSFDGLKNKRVSIGNHNSGTLPIAKELLKTSNINNTNCELLHLSTNEALKAFKEKKIDVLFYVASYPAKLVSELMLKPNIYLLDFPKAIAYRQYFLKEGKDYQVLNLQKNGFNLPQKVPKQNYTMLGKTTMLATREDMSNGMSRLLLQIAEQVHREAGMFNDKNIFPNAAMLKVKKHEASIDYFKQKVNYLERKIDYWYAQTINEIYGFVLIFILPIITIFAFVVEVILPAYSHFSRKKINKWYYLVNEIDTGMNELSKEEIMEKISFLKILLIEIRETDNIPAIHMGPFYTLQNQVVTILKDLERLKVIK